MKIGERFIPDEGTKFVVQEQHDFTPYLDQARLLRSSGDGRAGESRHVARLPVALIREWCKEAGVAWDDVHARKEVVRKKLMDGDHTQFRVWGGRY